MKREDDEEGSGDNENAAATDDDGNDGMKIHGGRKSRAQILPFMSPEEAVLRDARHWSRRARRSR